MSYLSRMHFSTASNSTAMSLRKILAIFDFQPNLKDLNLKPDPQ